MRKFLLLFFACLCSLIPLGAWAQDDDTESPAVGFWYYDYNGTKSFYDTYIGSAFSDAISTISVTAGSNFTVASGYVTAYNSIKNHDNWGMKKITYKSVESSAADDNAIDFTINVVEGYKFTPTSVEFYIKPANGQDTSKYTYLDFTWKSSSDDVGTALGKEESFSSDAVTHVFTFDATDFAGVAASTSSCTLRVNLFGEDNQGEWDICDVMIYGTVETSTEDDSAIHYNGIVYQKINETSNDVRVAEQSDFPDLATATGDIVIPETFVYNGTTYTVTKIGQHAFCEDGNDATTYRTDITSIDLPATIDSVETYSLAHLTLTTLTCRATTPPPGARNTFTSTTSEHLYVPCESVSAYKTVSYWSTFKDVASGYDCTFTPEITISDATSTGVTLTFDEEVELAETTGTITISNESGTVTTATISGSGTSWTLTFAETLAAGEYTITIPAGYFIDSNEATSTELTAEFAIEATTFALTITPENNTEIEEFDYVTPSYDGGTLTVAATSTTIPIYIDGESTNYHLEWSSTSNKWAVFNNSYSQITLSDPGEYTFTIPAGYFTSGNLTSAKLDVTYTILGAQSEPFELTFSDVTLLTDGSNGNNGLQVTITSDTGGTLTKNADTSVRATITKDGEEIALAGNISKGTSGDTWTMYFYPTTGNGTTYINDDGTYTVTFPDEFFKDESGTLSKQSSFEFTIGDVSFGPFTLSFGEPTLIESDQADGYTGLNIVVSSEDAVGDISKVSGAARATVTKDGETIATATVSAHNSSTLNPLDIYFYDVNGGNTFVYITEEGTYTVTIPAGEFHDSADPQNLSAEGSFTFTIEGEEESSGFTPKFDNIVLHSDDNGKTYNYLTVDITTEAGGTLSKNTNLGSSVRASITKDGVEVCAGSITAPGTSTPKTWTIYFYNGNSPVNISDEGTYTVTFQAEYFKDSDGNLSAESSFEFTIGDDDDDEPDPDVSSLSLVFSPVANGGTTSNPVSVININSEDGNIDTHHVDGASPFGDGYGTDGDYQLPIYLNGDKVAIADYWTSSGGGIDVPNADGSLPFTIFDTSLSTATPLTEAGTYTITIPQGYFLLGEDKENCQETTYTFTIAEGVEIEYFTPEFDPASGTQQTKLSTIKVSGENLTEEDGDLEVLGTDENIEVFVIDSEVEDNEGKVARVHYNSTTGELYFTAVNDENDTKVLNDVGHIYTIELPQSYFVTSISQKQSNSASLSYTIKEDTSKKTPFDITSVEPAEGNVTSLDYITISYTNKLNVAQGTEGSTDELVAFEGSDGNTYYLAPGTYARNNQESITFEIEDANAAPQELTTPGEYEITFPEGYFTDSDGNPSNTFTLTYTIVGFNLTLDPENGETLESLKSFNVYNEDSDITMSDSSVDIELYKVEDDGTTTKVGSLEASSTDTTTEEGHQGYTFNVLDINGDKGEITEEGTYTFTIPACSFTNETSNPNYALEGTYTISVTSSANDINISPEDNSILTVIDSVYIDAGGLAIDSSSGLTNNSSPDTGDYYYDNTPMTGAQFGFFVYKDGVYYNKLYANHRSNQGHYETDSNGNKVKWILTAANSSDNTTTTFTEPGTYTFKIPAGFFTIGDDGKTNPEYNITYTIPKTLAPTITASDATSESVTLTFSEEVELAGSTDVITISTADGIEVTTATIEGEGTEWTLKFEDELERGDYTITIPAGYFTNSEELTSSELTVDFTISTPIEEPTGTSGSISWPFNESSLDDNVAEIAEDLQGAVTSTVSVGSGITYSGHQERYDSGTNKSYYLAQLSRSSSATDDVSYIDFIIDIADDCEFTPTEITLQANIVDKTGYVLDVNWVDSNQTIAIASETFPTNNTFKNLDYTWEDIYARPSTGECKLRLTLSGTTGNYFFLGNINITGVVNGEYQQTFTLTLDPATGAVTEKLESIAVSHEDGDMTLVEGMGKFEIQDNEEKVVAYAQSSEEATNGVYTLTVTAVDTEEALETPGTYTLIIPQGSYSSDDAINEETKAEYIVPEKFELTFDPDPTENVLSLEYISVSYTGGLQFAIDTDDDEAGIKIEGPEGTEYTMYPSPTITNKTATFDIEVSSGSGTSETEITEPGTYTFTIPAGYFYDEDGTAINEESTVTYTIPSIAITIDTDDAVLSEDGSSITLAITATDGEEDIEFNVVEDSGKKITITTPSEKEDEEDVLVAYATAEKDEDTGNWVLSFIDENGDETTITDAGTYTITIPTGYFATEDGVVNTEATATFTIPTPQIAIEIDTNAANLSEDGTSITVAITAKDGDEDIELKVAEDSGKMITITTGEGDDLETVAYATAEQDENTGEWTLSFYDEDGETPATITEPGTYTITIPEGYFTNEEGTIVNAEATAKFTIEETTDAPLYATDFTDWTELNYKNTNGDTVTKTTATGGNLTFTFYGVGVDPTKTDADKFPDYTGTMITAKNPNDITFDPYATTSVLGSIDKIEFTQVATGNSRGITIAVRGTKEDGTVDEDWEYIFNQSITTASGETHVIDVNRTNCQIKFGSYAPAQNAYVADLKIYGTDADEITANWDWKNDNPVGIQSVSLEKTTGYVDSDQEGVELYVDASSGKLAGRTSGDAQFNQNTIIYVPVSSLGDVITVTNKPNYYGYTIGGNQAIDGTNTYSPTAEEVETGWVAIESTLEESGQNTVYLQSISVTLYQFTASTDPFTLEVEDEVVADDDESITITFDKIDLTVAEDLGDKQITVTTGEGDDITVVAYATVSIHSGICTFTFISPDPEDEGKVIALGIGTYSINIPDGYFVDAEGAEAEGMDISFTIEPQPIAIEIDTDDAVLSDDGTSITVAIIAKDEEGEEIKLEVAEDSGKKITITTTAEEGDADVLVAYATAEQDETTGEWTLSFVDAEDGVTPVAITEPGEYTITIPQGYFTTEDGAENAEATATFTIEEETETIDIVIDTDDAVLSDDGTSITVAITDEDGEAVALEVVTDSGKKITITTPAAEEGADDVLVAYATAEQNTDTGEWVLSFYGEDGESVEITAAGTYTITIPEGYFTTETSAENAEVTGTFTIEEETEPIAIVIDTDDAVLSDDGTSITVAITDEDGETVVLEVVTDSGKMITITTAGENEGDDDVLVAYATAEQDADTGEWVLSFVDAEDGGSVEITAAGTYTITIPQGYFTTETGAENAEATATFTIEDNLYETLCEEIEVLETNLKDTWSTIETEYPEAAKDASIIAQKGAIESEISELQAAVDASNEAGTLADKAEEYETQITAIQTEIESLLAAATGINSITIDKFEGKSIYTISGQKVNAPTKSGIYIIDGKKVVIK